MKLSSKHASRDVRRSRHIEFIALPAIAQVEAAFIFRPAVPPFRAEFLPRRRFQLAELFLQLHQRRLRSNSLKPPEHGARIILDHVADQNPKRRKRPRPRRNHHCRNRQRLGEFAGMQPARSSKRHQRKLSRIVPPFDRHHSQSPFHVRVDHAHNSRRKLFHAQARPLRPQPFGSNSLRSLQIELKFASQKPFWPQPPHQ